MNRNQKRAAAVIVVIIASTAAIRRNHNQHFADVQQRGASVMGVDQSTSTHVFEDLPDGGRIVLDRDDAGDSTGIATIRAHMRDIATAFRAGDFSKPFEVHAETVPGTDVMAAKHEAITYTVVDRPRGAEVDVKTSDTAAVAAIHSFLAFQRDDHRAAAHEQMPGMKMP